MVKQFLQSVAFQAGRLEMLGTIKPLTGPGLLCGQQNHTLSLRINCQRLISITWKVPMEALCSSLWGVNSANKCSNRFLSHCKWVSVKLSEWVDHTAVPRVALSSRYWHSLPVPMTSFLCMSCLLIRHLELKHLTFHQACRSCTYQPSCLTDCTWRTVSGDPRGQSAPGPLQGCPQAMLCLEACFPASPSQLHIFIFWLRSVFNLLKFGFTSHFLGKLFSLLTVLYGTLLMGHSAH